MPGGFECQKRLGNFLFTSASRLAMGPTQPPIQWVPGAFSLGVKWPRHEANHSPPSSAKVNNACEAVIPCPKHTFMVWHSVKRKNHPILHLSTYEQRHFSLFGRKQKIKDNVCLGLVTSMIHCSGMREYQSTSLSFTNWHYANWIHLFDKWSLACYIKIR
jgi:hypothetical protein